MNLNVVIVGAGGHGRSVAEALSLTSDARLIGFVDDGIEPFSIVTGVPVLGRSTDLLSLRSRATHAIVAIGNNRIRAEYFEKLILAGFELLTVIHPRAMVSGSAEVGVGVTIMAGAVIGCQAVISDGVIVNAGAVIDHDCVLEPFCHLGVGVAIAGGSRIGSHAWLHAGSAVGYQSGVAAHKVLLAGSVIT